MTPRRMAIVLSTIVVLGIGFGFPVPFEFPVVSALEPCCAIVGIQPNGLVTAKELGGAGRPFQLQVSDPVLLRSLRVGQPIQADFTTMRVSIRLDRLQPCCAIVSIAGKAIPQVPVKPGVRP